MQPQVQPLPTLTAAIVDVQESTRYSDSYRVVLVTAVEQIPLTDYSNRYNPQAKLSEQINQFLQDATRSQLLLKVNPFGGIWFLGLSLIPFSLKALKLVWSEVALIQQEPDQSIEEFYRHPKRK